MRNAGMGETQAGIKIAGKNINNLRYTDDTTLMAESEECLQSIYYPGHINQKRTVIRLPSLFLKVKEESEKVGLKLNIQKMKIMASGPITSWQIDGETVKTLRDFKFFLASESLQMVSAAMKSKDTCSLEKKQ